MPNYAPSLPLTQSPSDGFDNLQELRAVVLQNLKMVVLTAPGERIMDPEFGVGLRNYLFEQNSAATYSRIKTRISRQAETYLPYIDILDVEFLFEGDNKILASNSLLIKIKFFIRPLGANETLEVYA